MRLVLALPLALLLAACDSGGTTAPDSWAVETKRGTVYVDPAADPAGVVRHLEAGFERAKTRTHDPGKLERTGAHGLRVVVNPAIASYAYGRYLGLGLIEIAPGVERVMDHEVQHLIADQLGLRGACLTLQDHAGGCNLDGEWGVNG